MSALPSRALEGPFSASAIRHSDISDFAADYINLGHEDVVDYREQVRLLREKLDKYAAEHPDYGLIKTLLSGSLAKGTALKTLHDIDVAFYVTADKSPSSEIQLLEWLAQRLRDGYPQMKADQIKPNDHSVCVRYAVSGLSVDVVPIQYLGDSNDCGYLFASDGGDPIFTSIPLHLAFIRRRKALQKQHFAQVVRLTKWWIRGQRARDEKFKFKSFMVELILARLVDDGVSLSDYTLALERFFSYLVKSQLKARIYFTDYYPASWLPAARTKPMEIFDPVNSKNNVASIYDDRQRQKIVDAAQGALEAISEARYASTRGRAIDCWQEVLGPSFRG